VRRLIIAIAVVVMLAAAGTAISASLDKGRRLAGPFCVSVDSGVVRAVAASQSCRARELRKVGLAIPCSTLTNAGYQVLEKTSSPCKTARGEAGPKGAPGAPGPAGSTTVVQLTGGQANCVRITGSDGTSGVVCGTQGAQGPKGDPGATGAPGPAGAPGRNGDPGSCVCGKCSEAHGDDGKDGTHKS
jgi:hypothetical protein